MTPGWKLGAEILTGGIGIVGFLWGVYRLQKPFVKEDRFSLVKEQTDEKLKEVDKRLDKGSEEFKEIHKDVGEIKTSVAVIKVKTTSTETMVKALNKKFDDYHTEVKKLNGNKK